jgi:hypothetical protein
MKKEMTLDIIDLRGSLPATANTKRTPTHPKRSVTAHYNGPALDVFEAQQSWVKHLDFIARYHRTHLGENTIAYHYVIDAQGRVYQCRDDTDHTWHCANWTGNTSSIAVHFPLGGTQDATDIQWQRLLELTELLAQRHGFSPKNLYSHREWPHDDGPVQPGRWVGQTNCFGAPLTVRLKQHRIGPDDNEVLERFVPLRAYRVIHGIDFANIREGWSTDYPIADIGRAQLVPGAHFLAGALLHGQPLGGNHVWVWVVEAGEYREPGFIHSSIVEPVNE